MSVADIQAARDERRRGELEANRWGVLLNEATAARSAIRRGAIGGDPGGDLVAAFERFVVPMTREGEAVTGDGGHHRSDNLGYLSGVSFELPPGDLAPDQTGGHGTAPSSGPGVEQDDGSVRYPDFFTYASQFGGDLGAFASAFETVATGDGNAPPDPSEAITAFETAVDAAVEAAPANPTPLKELIELLTAGVRAARAHREGIENQLTNVFDDGQRTSTGMLQQYHDGLGGPETDYAAALFESLEEHPVAMLPVTLETSFQETQSTNGTQRELRVRVYPDDIHVDVHEPELTTQEERWGKVFWTQVYTGRFHRTQPNSNPPLPKATVTDKVPEDVEDVVTRTLWADSGRDGTRFADFSDDVESRYDEIKERAWELLIERAGRERAAYIVRRTEPVDNADSDGPETATSVLAGPPEGSDPATANGTIDDLAFTDVANRPDAWTRQPRARYLPGRWLVRLEWTDDDGTAHSEWVHAEYTVDQPLYVGPEPESVEIARDDRDADEGKPGTRTEEDTPNAAMEAVDAGMEWMVDFAETRRRGMALRIAPEDIGTATLPDHFDRVTVTGVRAPTTPEAATDELAELFAHQQYTDGLELLPSGTPTNNHDGAKSAYRKEEPPEASLDIEIAEPLTGATDPTDGTLLAQSLGLPTADDHAFAHVEGADGTEWLDGRHLQTALFPATLGYTLRQLLVPDAIYDGSASEADVDAAEERYEAIRDHFRDYVRASGPFPGLRIDDQPYGVLPAMSIDAGDDGSGGPGDAVAMVRDVVQFLRPFWAQSVPEVPTAGHEDQEGSTKVSPLERVRQVLQRGAVGDAYTRRLFLENRRGGPYQLTTALSNHGLSYDPRVARLKEFSPYSVHKYSEYGRGEYASISGADDENTDEEGTGYGTDRPSLITTLARNDPDNEFLDALPRMLNSDLIKFGMEPHLERFPGLVSTVYHDQGPISTWNEIAEILEADVVEPVTDWLKGDSSEPGIALYRLVDRTGEGVFDKYSSDPLDSLPDSDGGLGSVSLELTAESAPDILEYILSEGSEDGVGFDLDSVAEEKVVAALEVLYVDALDEWLGTKGVDFGPTDGQLSSMTHLDGTGLTASNIEDLVEDLGDWINLRIDRSNLEFPDEADRIKLFYEGAAQAAIPDDAEETQPMLQMANNLAKDFGKRLLDKHLVDYLVLGSTLRGASTEHFPHTSPGDAGSHVIPTTARKVEMGDRPSFEAKRIHDTSLFPQLLRFGAINAGLEALASIDPDSTQFSQGDLFERYGGGGGRYGLLGYNTSREIYEAWGYIPNQGPGGGGYDEIVDGFAGTRWNGLLNAMRSEQFVGKPETPDEFQAFQASLEYLADQGWLSPDRIDRTRRLVAGTLDLASHRLDAWWASLATRRLMDLRGAGGDDSFDVDFSDVWVNRTPEDRTDEYVPDWSSVTLDTPTGNTETYIGAYGVVEDLVRDGVTTEADADTSTTETAEETDEESRMGDLVETTDTDRPEITATDIETTLNETDWLETPPTTDGGTEVAAEYIQAPSIPQATTAAILRSGHRSEPSSGFKETLSVDLSPLRVQKAKWVLEGLRSGLWLGELMGYYFERRLHEVGEDTGVTVEQYISDFREYYPFQGDEIDHDEQSGSVEASTDGDGNAGAKSSPAKYDLVDGYELYQDASDESIDAVLDTVGIPSDTDVRRWTATVLGEVDEILDAVADLIVAENVHQLQQGNFGQAGRSLKALSEGKHPRQPEVLKTRRESVGVTHRLLVLFGLDDDLPGSSEQPPPAWQPTREVQVPTIADDGGLSLDGSDVPQTTTAETVVRDDGAPILNAFAGDLFPQPVDVLCTATYLWETESEEDGSATEHEVPVTGGLSLAELDLSPLDALYLTQQSGEAGKSKLENHVAYYLLRHRGDDEGPDQTIPADAELDVAFRELPDGAPDGAMTVGEFIEHARSLRDLVLDARPANATDLGHPGDEIEGERIAAQPVIDRATTATDRLRQVGDVLANRLAVVGKDDEEGNAASSNSGTTASNSNAGNEEIVPPVDAMETALEALDDAVPMASIESAARQVSGSELRSELETLLAHLPAGPTDAGDTAVPTHVEPGSATIELDIPVAQAETFVPATQVTVRGSHADQQRAYILEVEDPETGTIEHVQIPENGDRFEVQVDLATFDTAPDSLLRTIEFAIIEGDGVIEEIDPSHPESLEHQGREVTVGLVPDQAAARAFADGSATLDVEVLSTSPSSRFRTDKDDVPIADDGTCSPTFDFSGVQVGTPFTVVATYDAGARTHVAATTEGRVVGPDPANAIDDALFEGMTSLPRLLWLSGFEGPMAFRGPGASTSGQQGSDGPSPSWRLDDRLDVVPWETIERERALFPTTNTTYDQPKRDALAALVACSDVDLSKAADALTGSPTDRGLAPLATLLGLPDAISVVGRDDPFGNQTFFAPDDPAALAEARNRIEAFLDDPWPGTTQWAHPSWLLVDSGLVAFVRDNSVEDEFEALLQLVKDDAWAAATLDALVSDPGAFMAAVDDLLYHPSERPPGGTPTTVVTGLKEIASVAQSAAGTSAGIALDRFDAVADPVTDVADPLSTLAASLDGESIPAGGGSGSTFDSTVAGWTADLATELSPLVDALEAADLTTSLREGLLETLRRPMVRAAYFGVYGAMPAAASGGTETDRRNLSRQAETVLETVQDRLPPEDAADPGDLDAAIERLETIFGENYTVLPPFSPGNLPEVTRTFANEDLMTDEEADAGPLPTQTWLQRAARVRERPGMLRETLLYGEIATDSPHLRFDVGQLPHDPEDTWVGLDGVRPGGRDRVSMVAHTDEDFDAIVDGTASGPSRMVAGIAVDEWVERVPAEEETTSVAVRYDEPDNEAPQSILLATPPEPGTGSAATDSPWSLGTVEATFDETFAMTRYRGVTLEDLRPDSDQDRWMLGKLLPALYFAQDTHVQPNTPSLDLTSLDRFEDEAGNLLLGPWVLETDVLDAVRAAEGASDVATMSTLGDFDPGGDGA